MAIEISYLTTLPSIEGGENERASVEDFIASLIAIEPLVSMPPLTDFDFGLDELISRITSGSDEDEDEDEDSTPSGAFLDIIELLSSPIETSAIHPFPDLCESADLLVALAGADMFDFVSCPATNDDLIAAGTPAAALLTFVTDNLPGRTDAEGSVAAPAKAESTSDDAKIVELDAFDFLF